MAAVFALASTEQVDVLLANMPSNANKFHLVSAVQLTLNTSLTSKYSAK